MMSNVEINIAYPMFAFNSSLFFVILFEFMRRQYHLWVSSVWTQPPYNFHTSVESICLI